MEAIRAAILSAGASVTVNSIWALARLGGFDKLKAARRMMRELYAIDIETEQDTMVYVGDFENDAPMFAHFGIKRPWRLAQSITRSFARPSRTPPQITTHPGAL